MNLLQLHFVKKYIPVILLAASLIPILVCLNYRKNDYMTGAYLFIYIFLPATVMELLLLIAYYLSDRVFIKQIVITIEAIILGLLCIFMIEYIFRYN